MKIIHIAGGGDEGGAKPHIIDLCAALGQKHQIKLISLRAGPFSEEAAAAGVDTHVIFSRSIPADYLKVIRLIKDEKPDMVHCHGAKANLVGVLVKLFCKIPIVTTIHSDWRLDYLHSFVRRNTIGRINAVALKAFDYYTTVSDQFKNMLIERRFPPLRIMTIYNGIDFSHKTPGFDKAEHLRSLGLDYQPGDVVVGVPTRLEPVKDIPTLLRAFSAASAENPRLKLLVGGSGSEEEALRGQASQLGIDGKVCFAGWVTDVPRLLACCDIYVLCSISESFPYAVLEAIREKCAVIVSDVGGMRRLVTHDENGFIFDSGDDAALAGHLLELSCNEDLRRTFADRLYASASQKFSLQGMAATQAEIYSNILALEGRKAGRDGVLICGAYGRGNSGDEAILKAIIATMRMLDPLMPLTVMTRKPAHAQLTHGVRAVFTFNPFRFLRLMRKSKLFINGGGSLIQDSTSSRSLYFYLFTIWAAKRLGCKVLMYGCGIGPVGRTVNRRLASRIINSSADIITLRDSTSRQELERLRIFRPEVRQAADPALSLLPASVAEAEKYLAAHGLDGSAEYICFSVRAWKSFDGFDIFARAADYASQKYGLHTVFLPIESPKDIAPSNAVGRHMSSSFTLLPPPQDVTLTIALLKKMRLVCSMRLHALIFSAAAQTPIIASSYDVKVSSFMEYIGSDACCELDDLSQQWLCAQIDRVMQQTPKSLIPPQLGTLEAENSRAAAMLLGLDGPL